MKHNFIISLVSAVLLLISSVEANAHHKWAIAMIENGKETPSIMEYYSIAETAENGIEYLRIYDQSYLFRNEPYNPIKLQYGYRLADKQIYVYDFETQTETLAFDFNLSVGNHFTTYNGIEWEVEVATDTLVNISFCGKEESVSKRLLTVRTLDGNQTDQWLEDFGSFTNHFMINSLENIKFSHTLWMEYDMGEYLAREINTGSFFAHDSGWMDAVYDGDDNENYTTCRYENGNVVFENVQLRYEYRDYSCFYRDGDSIYRIYCWEMEPHVDSGTLALRQDIIIFKGLPVPASGKYVVHIGENEYSTNISEIKSSTSSTNQVFDLQGRKIFSNPSKGIYIKDGKKVIF